MSGDRVAVGGVLPSHKIMPRVDLAITAGGQGSVQCAMAAGTPLIGIPLQPEQDANVHFLQEAGAARMLSQRDLQRGRLPVLAQQVLAEGSYRASAQRIQAAYAKRHGPALSAAAILDYVAERVRSAA